jgi:hypothetical protein
VMAANAAIKILAERFIAVLPPYRLQVHPINASAARTDCPGQAPWNRNG